MQIRTVLGKVLVVGWAALFVAWWIVGTGPSRWAVSTTDAAHPYGIRFKGGTDWFFAPRLGWFVDHMLWILFGLLFIIGVAEWFAQNRHTNR